MKTQKKLNLNIQNKKKPFTLLTQFKREAEKAGWSQTMITRVIKEATNKETYEHMVEYLLSL